MSAMTLGQAALSFAVVAALMTLTPGLDTAIVLRATLRGGARAGWATAGGVVCGVFAWGLAGALGVSAALAASRTAFEILRIAGAVFLTWLGGRLLVRAARGRSYAWGAGASATVAPRATSGRARVDSATSDAAGSDAALPKRDSAPGQHGSATYGTARSSSDSAPGQQNSAWADARIGLGTNLLNPKVGAFYLAVIPQFLVEGIPPAAMGILLAGIHAVEGLAWFAVLISAAQAARHALAGQRVQRSLDALTGIVLVSFAARLTWEALADV